MDDILKQQTIIKDEKREEQNSLIIVPRKIPVEISQIEEDLSKSLKLLESGLLNLDIEAAHFLNPGGLKKSFSLKETSTNGEQRKIKFLHKPSTILSPKKTNDSNSSSELTRKNTSVPPDLTFSFYSSTDEAHAPFMSHKRQIEKFYPVNSFDESSCSYDDLHSTLDEILITSAKSDFSRNINFASEMKNKAEVNKDTQKETIDQFLNTKTETSEIVLEVNDLVDSLIKIQSALNDLDKEAAHILNPGYEVPYQNLSSLDDNKV